MTATGALTGTGSGALLFVVFGFYRSFAVGGAIAIVLLKRILHEPLRLKLFSGIFAAPGAAFAVLWGALFSILVGGVICGSGVCDSAVSVRGEYRDADARKS